VSFALDIALDWYLKRDLAIFPCKEKKPLIGTGFKAASKDPEQVKKWWTTWPAAQFGVPTGQLNNLLVVDIDGPKGQAWLAEQNWNTTFTVQTSPGHLQLWFIQPEGITTKCTAGQIAPEVDIRGDGGYVIGPFSFHHETKHAYTPLSFARNRIDAPPSLLELATSKNGDAPFAAFNGDGIPEGSRHQRMLQIAGSLRRQNLSTAAILDTLRISNQQYCKPPLEDAELERIAKDIGKKPVVTRGQQFAEACAEVEIESFAGLVPEKVEWLWKDRIPLGKLTIFGGDPGMGKSLVTLDVASRLSTERSFCDGSTAQIADTIFLTAEDGTLDTVLPRLIAAGADLSRIHRIKAVKVTLADGTLGESHFSLDRDLEKLERELEKMPQVRLVVIDPISAYMGRIDTHKDADVRRVLTPVAALAERRKVSIGSVMHLKKAESSALHRLSGSIGFTAAARAVWGFGEDPDDPSKRLMVSVKNNLAARRDGDGLSYKIDSNADGLPFITWLGSVTAYADEVLSADIRKKRRGGQTEAADWLRELLSNGPMPQQQIEAKAEQADFSWRTVRRAKDALGIKPHKAGFSSGGWMWQLPETQKENEL
jgi:hypothetical protein